MPNYLNDPNIQSMEITEFQGPDLISDEVGEAGGGIGARNVEYIQGQVQSRRGFAEAWDPSVAIYSMYNWLQTQFNRLVYLTSAGAVISRDLVTPANTYTLVTGLTTSIGMNCVASGDSILMAFFKERSANPGNPQCAALTKIWDGTVGVTITDYVETAFPVSMDNTEVTITKTEPGAGTVTAGDHKVGFIFTTWNGGTPPPAPFTSGVFTPTTLTATGSKNLTITLTPTTTWPIAIASISPIMSTVDNPNRFYILPYRMAPIRGTSTAVVFQEIDIDDVTLQLYEEILPGTANDYFSVVTNDGTLAGPAGAMKLLSYGTRTVYIHENVGPNLTTTVSYIAISEPGRPQFVTQSQHVLTLPEFKSAITGFVLGDVLYILGATHTYAFSDNSQIPVKWSQPRLVSGSIGSPFINGVLSSPSRGYAWVASRSGLFWFGGSAYPDLPSSYKQTPDWQRINWLATVDSLEIIEDVEYRLVMVKAPLDAAVSASHWLVWDYTNGFSPEQIRYCGTWAIDSFSPGGCASVINPTTNSQEIWAARRTSGNVLRLSDTEEDLHDDDGAGIDDMYKLGPLPGVPALMLDHIGGNFRIRGEGDLSITVTSLDQTNPVSLIPIPMEATPSRRVHRAISKQSEAASVEITSGGVAGNYFILSALRWFWRTFAVRT